VPSSYVFPPYELDATQRRLLKAGQHVPIGARALDVLLVLLAARHRIVSKGELLDSAWAGLVVEENNLQVQVSTLRKVLGADAIATVPGIGYQFTRQLQAEPALEGVMNEASQAGAATRIEPNSGRALLGRQVDLQAVQALLDAQPLVTVTGPGGMGKTRLAQALAEQGAPDWGARVFWVNLAELGTAEDLLPALAQALGLPVDTRAGPAPLMEAITSLAATGPALLVLDNAESHIAAVASLVSALRRHAPGWRLLVTSQLPLKVAGEWVHRLGPLPCPPTGAGADEAQACAAVALFIEEMSATGSRPTLNEASLSKIGQLCRQLDGMPLAIKLAAARGAWMGVDALLDILGPRLYQLQTPDAQAPARHQTVQATLAWSHSLLSPQEQWVFRQLGVMRGSFSLPYVLDFLADGVGDRWTTLDLLSALVDRSLVSLLPADPPRYHLLESARQHALSQLAEHGELPQAQQRHAAHTLRWMQAAHQAYWHQDDARWLATHAADIEHIRSALSWSAAHDPAQGVALLGASACLFMQLGLAAEARDHGHGLGVIPWREELAAGDLSPESVQALGRFCVEMSRLYWGVSHPQMQQLARQGLALHQRASDPLGMYLALRCLVSSGPLADPQEAPVLLLREMQALEDPSWPPRVLAQGTYAQLAAAMASGRTDDALTLSATLLARSDDAGLSTLASAARCAMASVHLMLGEALAAMHTVQPLLEAAMGPSNGFIIHAHGVMAEAHLQHGDLPSARRSLEQLLQAALHRDGEWLSLYADLLACLALHEGRAEHAARLLGHAQRVDPHMRAALTGRPDRLQGVQEALASVLPAHQQQAWMTQGRGMSAAALKACLLP
jgi:predicted ATPase/DNA-binding winged helix-turn-helix (wHTH) protein